LADASAVLGDRLFQDVFLGYFSGMYGVQMAITLTDSAADRVRTYLAKRGTGIGLRLGIKKTGCSGYSYLVNYADEVGDDDVVFSIDDVNVIVDKQSLEIIDGTEIDYVREGLNEAFKFRNPQSVGECGCGESFSI
jgi:iron-sulfur cluster assembly protein